MGALFRSEEMTLCQFFIQTDATFWCLAELGEMGVVQFRDVCVCDLDFVIQFLMSNLPLK